MKLIEEQWRFLEPLIPKEKVRQDKKGRPWKESRDVLQGILWILKTGARWQDLLPHYPPYQTCHRRFQQWVEKGVMKKILEALVEHLRDKGKIDLAETFIDASFVKAKKGGSKSEKPRLERAVKSWQSSTISLFLSPYPLKVLHRMRVDSLKARFGSDIRKTYLCGLSETKLTIATHWMIGLQNDIASGSLLPTSRIEGKDRLKMEDLFDATKEDGRWNDSSPGFNDLDA